MAETLTIPDERDRSIKGRPDTSKPYEDAGGELEIKMLDDGGAEVSDPSEPEPKKSTGFDENLVELLPGNELTLLAQDLTERIEHDKESRRKRDEQYEMGLKRTGLADDAPGGAQFTGASKVVHPMLIEAAVDFHAIAMKEIFPPSGPVRTEIIGKQTPEQLSVADRQFRYMNWQMTEQIEEYADELSVTMTQLPMGGSQYMKFYPDPDEKRPTCEFVPIDDLLVPYGCPSFWKASRITHVQRISENTYDDRVDAGIYADLPEVSTPAADTPETTKSGQQSDKIEGVEQPVINLDGLRIVYEVNTYCKISVDGEKRLPYLVSIDERTNKIIAIYRNWEEDDKRQKRLHWIVDFNFIPWRGAYKLGIAQMIGGLSAAATGSLRALLDSALVQTIPVLARLKSAKTGAQSKTIDPMSMVEIEAGTAIDDIRKALMALPFNPPSPVLFQLLGWLTDAAKGVVTTAEEKIADAGNNMPVGTSLALIEQGSKVWSSIHAGLHRSQKKALHIIARLNKDWVDKEGQLEKFGEVICTEEDFRKPLGVIPVSDPNIFSEGQRYAQMQLVLPLAQGMDPKTGQPTATGRLHNLYEVLKNSYTLAKIPNIDKILPPPKEPTELNAAAENSAVMLGNPVMAFPEQEHFAHLETHMRFITDPLFGGNPAAVPQAWPPMLEHIKQHLSFLYGQTMHKIASKALGADVSELMQDKQNWKSIDRVLAAASRIAHSELMRVLQPLGPIMIQMLEKIDSMKPPAPMDPSQSALMIAKMEDARAKEKDKSEAQLGSQELDAKRKKDQADAHAKDEQNRIKEEELKLKYGQAAADSFRKNLTERERLGLDRAKLEHDQALGQHGAQLDRQDQQHRHSMEAQGAARDAQDMQHRHGMDHAGHELERSRDGHERMMSGAEHTLKVGQQEHDQTLDVAGHAQSVQQNVHTQRMAEADHEQRQREHSDGIKQQEKQRKDEGARHAADLKAQSQAQKSSNQKKGK